MRRYKKRSATSILLFIVFLLQGPHALHGQELEPRSLTNVPVGSNFALLGYAYSSGNILMDPALPIDNLNAKQHLLLVAYVRSIDFFAMSGKVDIVAPFSAGDWEGQFEQEGATTARTGFGDPRIRLSVNFTGAPALRGDAFKGYKQQRIIGGSLQVFLPLGQYDSTRLLNLGSNRWTFRVQIGVSQPIGSWLIEGHIGGWFFTDNPEFLSGFNLSQRPLVVAKLHLIRSLRNGMWFALDGGYGLGGRTLVDGVERDTHISGFRLGVTLAAPFGLHHALKLFFVTGKRIDRGPDYDAAGLSYQYRWGGK